MFWAIFITVIICLLLFVVYAEYQARKRAERKCGQLRADNLSLRQRVDRYDQFEVKRLCRENYRRGLDDGAKCDALYRSILSKYKSKEQITVMMYGEPEEGANDEQRSQRVY